MALCPVCPCLLKGQLHPHHKTLHPLQSFISLNPDMSGDIICIFFRGLCEVQKCSLCCLRATPCHRGLTTNQLITRLCISSTVSGRNIYLVGLDQIIRQWITKIFFSFFWIHICHSWAPFSAQNDSKWFEERGAKRTSGPFISGLENNLSLSLVNFGGFRMSFAMMSD